MWRRNAVRCVEIFVLGLVLDGVPVETFITAHQDFIAPELMCQIQNGAGQGGYAWLMNF
jgi:hypothetical protein